MKTLPFPQSAAKAARAFTLIELLVVISIIAVLMGLLFPAFGGVRESANKSRAKNDLLQIVSAVKNYYTEYGRYPLPASVTTPGDFTYSSGAETNAYLIGLLRGTEDKDDLNPRGIRFLEVANAKSADQPKGGIALNDKNYTKGKANVAVKKGDWLDPWGSPYVVLIDGDYGGDIDASSSYTDVGDAGVVQIGVGAISLGKDLQSGKAGGKLFNGSDDVASWQ